MTRVVVGIALVAFVATLAADVPANAQHRLRKFGPCDLKVESAVYSDYAVAAVRAGTTGDGGVPERDLFMWAQHAAGPPLVADQLHLASDFLGRDPDLESLLAMAEVDESLIRIAPDFTWTRDDTAWPRKDPGLTAKRWGAYRALFASAGVPEGVFRSRDFPGAVFFIARAQGTLLRGAGAGYAHSADELPARSGDYTFREIEPQWYIWYESDGQPR